jgi:Ca2+-binding RTX toxin-like protein
MSGGLGNDAYVVDDGGDFVNELASEGSDIARTTLTSYTLGGNVENLSYLGMGGFTGTGNGLDNTINGSLGSDSLSGGAGNDRLNSGAGGDTLNGGAGNDNLGGGTGNDVFQFGAGFGQDRILDFDANPAGGQDLLNIASLGISAATFAANVAITDVGADTRVIIGANSITLVGVADATTVTQADFIVS